MYVSVVHGACAQMYLNVWCLSPSVALEPLKKSHSIVIASGTLHPLASLAVRPPPPPPPTASPHPCCLRRSWALCSSRSWRLRMSSSPSRCSCARSAMDRLGTRSRRATRTPRRCSSSRTSALYSYDVAAGHRGRGRKRRPRAQVQLCDVVPGGILVFFPSYHLLERLLSQWRKSTLYGELERRKSVFVEARRSGGKWPGTSLAGCYRHRPPQVLLRQRASRAT